MEAVFTDSPGQHSFSGSGKDRDHRHEVIGKGYRTAAGDGNDRLFGVVAVGIPVAAGQDKSSLVDRGIEGRLGFDRA